MAVQSSYGKLAFSEDFLGIGATAAIADATAGTRYNDIGLVAVSGQTDLDYTVDEPNGVISFTGAGGAGDGISLYSAPMRPDRNGTIWVEARFKKASTSDGRIFLGFQSTFNQAEPVNPFTLSGTTLTANNVGEGVGFYTDFGATTDDFRFLSSSAGTADLSAAYDYTLQGQTVGTLGIRSYCTVTSDSYYIARVEIDPDGTARGYFGHESMANNTGLTLVATLRRGTLTTSSLYFPHLMMVDTSTGDALNEVDYFRGGGNRYWGA